MHTSSELDVLYTLIHTLTLTLTHKIYKTPTSIFVSTRQMKVLSTLNDRHFHSYDNHRLLIIMKFCISLFFSWCFRFLGLLVVSNGAKLWSSTLLPLALSFSPSVLFIWFSERWWIYTTYVLYFYRSIHSHFIWQISYKMLHFIRHDFIRIDAIINVKWQLLYCTMKFTAIIQKNTHKKKWNVRRNSK